MIIAIDGPAGTGKSTIASMIAKKLNITFLNSGGFYRALTIAILDAGVDYSDEEKTIEFCRNQKIEYTADSHFILNGKDVTAHLHDDRVFPGSGHRSRCGNRKIYRQWRQSQG